MSKIGKLLKQASATALVAGLTLSSAAAETFMPNCYIPAPGNEKIIRYEAKEGPYRVALVNGHTGIPWREQMIQSVRAWSERPENSETISELRVVSTGPDVATQIAAVDNFIQAGYDAIVFIAVKTAFCKTLHSILPKPIPMTPSSTMPEWFPSLTRTIGLFSTGLVMAS